jgi:hypothetical protein
MTALTRLAWIALPLVASGCLRLAASGIDDRRVSSAEAGAREGGTAADCDAQTVAATSHLTLVYGDSKGLRFRRMELGGTWGGETALPLIGSVRWTKNQISPGDLGDEVAVAQTETPSGLRLYLLHRGPRGWSTDQMIELAMPAIDSDKRVFDLAWDRSGRQALLIHSDETSNPVYRTYEKATGWSSPASLFASPPAAGRVRWVVLAASQTSDELALAYADTDTNVVAVRWREGKLVQPAAVLLNGPTGEVHQSFDLAYEGKSGRLLAIGGRTCCSCPEYWLDAEQRVTSPGQCAPAWSLMKLSPRAVGDEIILLGDQRHAMVWTGTDWANVGRAQPPAAPEVDHPLWWVDGAWLELSTPTAVTVHRGWLDDQSVGRGKIFWATSQGPSWTWTTGTPLPVADLGQVVWPQVVTLPGGKRVLAVLSDDKGSLWAASFDGAAWTVSNNGAPVGRDLATVSARAFSMDVR